MLKYAATSLLILTSALSFGSEPSFIENVKEEFFRCPLARDYWGLIESAGAFSVEEGDEESCATGAALIVGSRRILITPTCEHKPAALLYELASLAQAEYIDLFLMLKCDFDTDEFAKGVELMDYSTTSKAHEIAEECVDGGWWPAEWDEFAELFAIVCEDDDCTLGAWADFEDYLAQREGTGHTDMQRLQWYEECAPEELADWVEANMAKWEAMVEGSES